MNRAERRKLSQGNKKIEQDLKYLDTPVTLKEAVQIARGAAEDVVSDYNQNAKPLQVAMSLQLEMIKEIIIQSGLITEEEYRNRYTEQVKAFNEMQRKALAVEEDNDESEEEDTVESTTPTTSAKVSNIEVQKV